MPTANCKLPTANCQLPTVHLDRTSVYAQYTVFVDNRDAVAKRLNEQGIPTAVHYPVPLHRQPCFAKHKPAACPVSDHLATEVVSLPCFPGLTAEEQDTVIAEVRRFYGK